MLDVGTLVAFMTLDTKPLDRGLDQSKTKMQKFGAFAAKTAAFVGTAFAALGAINFVRGMVEQASDLGESMSKIGQIFGDQQAAIVAFSETADRALGLSKQAALDSAAMFATFGKGAGLAGQELTAFAKSSVTLAGDLASFFNTNPAEAAEAIGAALRGENEPIRAYGVLLDEATIKAQAVSMGLLKAKTSVLDIKAAQVAAIEAQRKYNQAVKEHGPNSIEAQKAGVAMQRTQEKLAGALEGTTGDLTQQQKVLAAQAAIIEQTKDAQGDFARTSGGLANQQRILAAEFANAKAELGQALLPAASKFVTILKDMVRFGRENKSWLLPTIAALGGLAAIIYLVVSAMKAWVVVQWALNIALAANPIGLIILAILALVAGIYLIWTNSAGFRDFFIGLWNGIWSVLKAVGAWFAGPFADFFVDGWNRFTTGLSMGVDWVADKITWLVGLPGRVTAAMLSGAISLGLALYNGIKLGINKVIQAWNALDFGIHIHLPDWLPAPFGGRGFDVNDIIPDIPQLAKGGLVKPTAGGTVVRMAEAGQVEIASPVPMLRRIVREESGYGGQRVALDLTLHGDGVLRGVRYTARVQSGDAQTSLVGAAS